VAEVRPLPNELNVGRLEQATVENRGTHRWVSLWAAGRVVAPGSRSGCWREDAPAAVSHTAL